MVNNMDKKDNNVNSNIELKIEFLAKRYEDANRFFKFTLSVITGTIVILGIALGYFSFASRQDVTKAISEMENKVTDAISEMQRKFEVLSQQALKLPKLELFYKDELVSGKTITIPFSGKTVALNKLFIKNVGEKIANDIAIKIYLSDLKTHPERIFGHGSFIDWDITASSYEDFPWVLKLQEKLTLSLKEPWFFPEVSLDPTFNQADEILLDTLMKVEVYYSLEKPIITEIKFDKPKNKE